MKKIYIIYTSIIILLMTITLYLSNTLTISNINENFIHLITRKFNNKLDYKIDFVSIYIKTLKSSNANYFKKEIKEEEKLIEVSYNTDKPLVYIYSTHSSEEYSYVKNDVYNIVPNVKTASYILESSLEKLGINTIVEEKNTTDILNQENLPYQDSYKISRTLLLNKISEYDTLNYFIDLHRDSVKRSITTVEINGKSYARIMFVLGLENENYSKNKEVMTKVNDYLNTNYPGLSRGIYEKKGSGVNGVYNQDINPNTMLIEVGGVDNTIEEVSNSIEIIADSIYNLINY